MKTLVGYSLLIAGSAMQMMAVALESPEIGASTATGALALIGSAMLVFRSRRQK